MLSDDEILERAAQILKNRQVEEYEDIWRLHKTYGRAPHTLEHQLGQPRKLSMVEALVVAALDRTRYVVTAECPNNNRWHGDAECSYGVRGMVIATMLPSRLELLWELWRSVSDQPVERVALTEAHLRGSILHEQLRELSKRIELGNPTL